MTSLLLAMVSLTSGLSVRFTRALYRAAAVTAGKDKEEPSRVMGTPDLVERVESGE